MSDNSENSNSHDDDEECRCYNDDTNEEESEEVDEEKIDEMLMKDSNFKACKGIPLYLMTLAFILRSY